MTREIEPAKPTLKHLMVLKRMIEENLGLCVASHVGSRSYSLFHRDMSAMVPKSHDWFEQHMDGRTDISHSFWKWGWAVQVKKPPEEKDSFGRAGIFAWYDQPYQFTKQAREYWEQTGSALYEKLVQAEAEKRAKVERLVAIRAKSSYYRPHGRTAGMLVRVIRETESRLYVEVVDSVKGVSTYEYLGGNRGKLFIERDQVTMEHITPTRFLEISQVEDMIQSEIRVLRDEETRAIQEVRDRFAERRLQKSAEHEDMMRSVL